MSCCNSLDELLGGGMIREWETMETITGNGMSAEDRF